MKTRIVFELERPEGVVGCMCVVDFDTGVRCGYSVTGDNALCERHHRELEIRMNREFPTAV